MKNSSDQLTAWIRRKLLADEKTSVTALPPCKIEAKIHAIENLKDIDQRIGFTSYYVYDSVL